MRDFVAQEVKPAALDAQRLDACDRRLLAGVLDKASQIGLRTLALPEELGGAGADMTLCIVTEELAVGDVDVAAVLAETSGLAGVLFSRMTAEQRERLLPEFLADDRCHLARAVHEPEADTALGIHYHRPGAIERAARPRRRAPATVGSSTASSAASPTRRSPGCLRSRPISKDMDPALCWCRAIHPA